jgi:hypothetical protein
MVCVAWGGHDISTKFEKKTANRLKLIGERHTHTQTDKTHRPIRMFLCFIGGGGGGGGPR